MFLRSVGVGCVLTLAASCAANSGSIDLPENTMQDTSESRVLRGSVPEGITAVFAIDTSGRSDAGTFENEVFTINIQSDEPVVFFAQDANGLVLPLVFPMSEGGENTSVIPDFTGTVDLGSISVVLAAAARDAVEDFDHVESEENPLEDVDSDDDGESNYDDSDDDDDGVEDAEDEDDDGDGDVDAESDLDSDDDGEPDLSDDDDDGDGVEDADDEDEAEDVDEDGVDDEADEDDDNDGVDDEDDTDDDDGLEDSEDADDDTDDGDDDEDDSDSEDEDGESEDDTDE